MTESHDEAVIDGPPGDATRPGWLGWLSARHHAGMDRPSWAPLNVDTDTPNAARMYDYSLGGSHNFAVDRDLVDKITATMPEGIRIAHANRDFLRRAVRTLIAAGVRQFLDLGSGIPTVGNVHEIAQKLAPDTRVMYVDLDPVAVAHAHAILGDDGAARVIQGDLRDPETILSHPHLHSLLDLQQPVAVLLCAVLHFVPDADAPSKIIHRLIGATAPDSYLVISHGSRDTPPETATAITQVYQRTSTPLSLRTREEITTLFAGLELLPPGLVSAAHWRPDGTEKPEQLPILAGVARRTT